MVETAVEVRVQGKEYEEIFRIRKLRRHFNAAAWWGSDGKVVLLARYAQEPSPEGEPDKGSIVTISTTLEEVKTDLEEVLSTREVWRPEENKDLLEDPRAIELPDGGVLIGLTAVRRAENGYYLPYPALLHLDSKDEIPEISNPDMVIEEFGPGKNFTPVDSKTFLFRQEGQENNHKLLVIKRNEQENTLVADGVLEFPTDLQWASFKVGTAMPPIWVNEKEALMIFHGIEIIDGKYIYSLGVAKLEKDQNGKLRLGGVYQSPILQPDDLNSTSQGETLELHPKLRRVVYACGGVIEQNQENKKLVILANQGDIATVGARYDLGSLMSHFSWNHQ